ncbi:hypothetical protein PR048_021679 [Dryococelus australis]|uniref:Uncharacterized protein n=1 Tax=Dryococelus australis TaxID=614101 RepID=A0ABQ9GYX6_9NEOP|nr:hypothetical protein PR048_021679 [Dryococelus australis]
MQLTHHPQSPVNEQDIKIQILRQPVHGSHCLPHSWRAAGHVDTRSCARQRHVTPRAESRQAISRLGACPSKTEKTQKPRDDQRVLPPLWPRSRGTSHALRRGTRYPDYISPCTVGLASCSCESLNSLYHFQCRGPPTTSRSSAFLPEAATTAQHSSATTQRLLPLASMNQQPPEAVYLGLCSTIFGSHQRLPALTSIDMSSCQQLLQLPSPYSRPTGRTRLQQHQLSAAKHHSFSRPFTYHFDSPSTHVSLGWGWRDTARPVRQVMPLSVSMEWWSPAHSTFTVKYNTPPDDSTSMPHLDSPNRLVTSRLEEAKLQLPPHNHHLYTAE